MVFSEVSDSSGLSKEVAVTLVLPGFFAIRVTLFESLSLETTSNKSSSKLQQSPLSVASKGFTVADTTTDSPFVIYEPLI